MLRAKQKKEEEAKAKAAAAAAAAQAEASADAPVPMDVVSTETNGLASAGGGGTEVKSAGGGKDESKVRLLGIGGQSVRAGAAKGKRRQPAELRIQKDIAELEGGNVAKINFPNPNDLTTFTVDVSPDSGLWQGACYHFVFNIPDGYPHTPPKVTCTTRILHPNIDMQGNVCLNILRADWKPILDINAVIYGLIYLFYEPNPDDPLNREAADLFRTDLKQFERLVQSTLRGGVYGGYQYEKLKR